MLEKQHRQGCIQIRVGHRTQGSMESREGTNRMCRPSRATAAYRSGRLSMRLGSVQVVRLLLLRRLRGRTTIARSNLPLRLRSRSPQGLIHRALRGFRYLWFRRVMKEVSLFFRISGAQALTRHYSFLFDDLCICVVEMNAKFQMHRMSGVL